MLAKIMKAWQYGQRILDVDGDAIMLLYTIAIIFKTLKTGLNPADAAAYSAAVGIFGYGKAQKEANK